jgi:hypothetical protein
MERRIDIGPDQSKGAMFTISKPFLNETPQHSADLGFLFETGMTREEQEAIMRDIRELESIGDLSQTLRTSEFYEWVNYFVP